MKNVVIAIFVYCCTMACAIVVMLWLDVQTVRLLGRQLAKVEENAAEVNRRADAVQAEFDDLAREQRRHRPQLDGEDAIVVSQAVQQLNDQLAELRKQEIAANAAVTSNQDLLEKQELQFVPHIAFLMLHALAIWLFWPWRVFAVEQPRRRKYAKWTPRR